MNDTTQIQSSLTKIALLLALLAGIGVVMVSSHILSANVLSALADADDRMTYYIHAHKITSAFVFALAFTLIATVALPLESAMCVLAGYYFRAVLGVVISVFAITVGAALTFLIIRYFFKEWFREKFESRTLTKISEGLEREPFAYILFLRLVPLFPHLVTNTALSVSNVRMRDYFFATFIGIIPAATIFVLTGTQLESIKRTGQVLSPDSLGVLLLLAFFALLPLLWKKYFSRD